MENRILFQKPDLKKLCMNHVVVDMHMHSKYSDGINKVEAIIQKAKRLGIGIAITDHNQIKGAVEIDKYKNILTIPGIEITPKEGSHLLVYFYDIESLKKFYKNDIMPYMGNDQLTPLTIEMEKVIIKAKKYKTLIIIPHPYALSYTGIFNDSFPKERIDKILKMVDGIEVINAENLYKWNVKGALLGFNLNKSITGGSDAHTLYHMGYSVTYADCKKDRASFLNAIKNKKTKVMGKEIDMLRKVTVNSFKLKRTLRNYPDVIEKSIKYNYRRIDSKRKNIAEKVKKAIKNGIVKRKRL